MQLYDTIIIGGGQAGLATAYFMRRTKLNYLILDDQEKAGGAWKHAWESLKLFSPADASSLPGWMMPKGNNEYPTREEVIAYLKQYEQRYKLPIERPVQVQTVERHAQGFLLRTSKGDYLTKTVVSATGTYKKPYIPSYPGKETFEGHQLHSAQYKNPKHFAGKKVLIVGGGNSGAQILAEVSKVAQTIWITEKTPKFLPDEVDGRYLFSVASKIYEARKRGETYKPLGSLGDIVMVDSVKEARERDVLHAREPFERFTETGVRWANGQEEQLDAVIWCTGFQSALDFLAPLGVMEEDRKVATKDTRSLKQPGLWLVGYGGWTGFASATLIGVGRTARQTAQEIEAYLGK